MNDYLEFATKLARQAGEIMRSKFDQKLDVEIKADESPVTQVDKQINTLVIESIRAAYPTHGIMGEEADHGDGSEKFQWLCDPLDGTKPYILGIPQSMFMLALLEDGVVQMSVTYDPYADKLFHAIKGQGAYCNGERIHVSGQRISGGIVVLDNSSLGCLDALAAAGGRLQQLSGTAYKCMMVAQGKVTAFVNNTADFHDIGPASLIVEEAGGKVTGLDGSPLSFTGKIADVAISNGVDHDLLLEIMNTTKR